MPPRRECRARHPRPGYGQVSPCPDHADGGFTSITLPALPFVLPQRLPASPEAWESKALPHALCSGIIAHCTSYIPAILPLHRSLWQQALLALEDEYRKPRLRTLQLALLLLTSRPSENVGQSEIGLARVSPSKARADSRRWDAHICWDCIWIRRVGRCRSGRSAYACGYGGRCSSMTSGVLSCTGGHLSTSLGIIGELTAACTRATITSRFPRQRPLPRMAMPRRRVSCLTTHSSRRAA